MAALRGQNRRGRATSVGKTWDAAPAGEKTIEVLMPPARRIEDNYFHLPRGLGELSLSQLYGVNRCLSEQPERSLLGAVLEEAVETLAKHMGKPGERSRKLVQDVLEWFETRGDEKRYFTCDYVCLALGLNTDWFRREMRQALQQRIDLTPILRERRYT